MSRHHHPTNFIDTGNGNNAPSGRLAGVYVRDGQFTWSEANVHRMLGVFGISESGDPRNAKYARCCAVEDHAALPSQLPGYIEARRHEGHHDSMGYVNQDNWEAAEQACIDAGLYPLHWWLAAPGMSLAECHTIVSPIRKIHPVAVQNFWGQAYDVSVLLGDLVFTNPHDFTAI